MKLLLLMAIFLLINLFWGNQLSLAFQGEVLGQLQLKASVESLEFEDKTQQKALRSFRDDFTDRSTYLTPTLWYSPSNGSSTYFLDGVYYASGKAPGAHLRTLLPLAKGSYRITADLKRSNTSGNHFIALSSNSTLGAWSWTHKSGYLKLGWDQDSKILLGQHSNSSTDCASFGDYRLTIDLDREKKSINLSDSEGCADLSATDDMMASGNLYLYLGGHNEAGNAQWYDIEVEEIQPLNEPVDAISYPETELKQWLIIFLVSLMNMKALAKISSMSSSIMEDEHAPGFGNELKNGSSAHVIQQV
eukprot:CAMPEP_0117781640 /NCGR_PEP_ID=MMETSP0948-20121206/2965_1 /TAXON_ID=44440 /ORGANISM="Chattonella subsalsa, Strain CCMP2191" /LENGTH=303 /DNA_ID=CAMNT_0005609707 /DNA_START=62 /DNA_END=973 /DNA_ORIENTATION=+